MAAVTKLHERLKEQDLRNKLICELVEDLQRILPYVSNAESFARLVQLKSEIDEFPRLIEDSVNFIFKYSSQTALGGMMRAFVISADQSQINELRDRISRFKEQFDRGVAVQTGITLEDLLNMTKSHHDDAVINQLRMHGLDDGSRKGRCMDGTCTDILEKFAKWMNDFDASNVLWIHGHPGAGKSAIAETLVQQLRESKRFGASFFFQRDKAKIMTPVALWRTVAFELARQYPSVRRAVVDSLNADSSLVSKASASELFLKLVFEPLKASEESISTQRLPIIIIDALDECGGMKGPQSEDRLHLVPLLKSWSELSRKFKLVLTSRKERDIERVLSRIGQIIDISDRPDQNSTKDIKKLLISEFQSITQDYPHLPHDWPGENKITRLAANTGGLFIWATTAIKFVAKKSPERALDQVLDRKHDDGNISSLYSQILDISFESMDKRELSIFHSILGTIIFAKMPLASSTLQELLSVESSDLSYICNGLRSVLDEGAVLRISHQSFTDFLIDPKRCPSRFLIDRERESETLTTACLDTMEIKLRYNICDLEMHVPNDKVTELSSMVEQRINPHLSYSCQFWAEHLQECRTTLSLVRGVREFLERRFLFWLEVLSLIKTLDLTSSALSIVIAWCTASKQEDVEILDYQKVIIDFSQDGQRFVRSFAIPISQATGHIYRSALHFAPQQSLIRRQYLSISKETAIGMQFGLTAWQSLELVLSGHKYPIFALGLSRDGQRIVSGSDDHTVRMWNVETGEVIGGPLRGHGSSVFSVAFSHDGTRVVSGSGDNTIRIWNVEDGEPVGGPLGDHQSSVYSVSFSPDDRRIVSGSYDKTVRLWDVETGKMIGEPMRGHTSSVYSVKFSPNGKLLASCSDDTTIRVWDAETHKAIGSPLRGHEAPINYVAFSPDGYRIVSASDDLTVRVWDVRTGEPIGQPLRGHEDWIPCAVFSPCGQWIVSGSYDNTVRLWNAETGNPIGEPLRGHEGHIYSVMFSLDSHRIISASADKTIRVWNMETVRSTAETLRGHYSPIYSVAFSSDGRHLVSGSEDKTVRIWNTDTGEPTGVPLCGHKSAVYSVVFSSDGTQVVSGSLDSTIRLWNAKTGKAIGEPLCGHTSAVNTVAISQSGQWIVSGSSDSTIRLWEAKTGKPIGEPLRGHESLVNSVIILPNEREIISASADSTLRVWDVTMRCPIGEPLRGHELAVNTVAYSPNGQWIVSGSADKTIRLWSTEASYPCRKILSGHGLPVSSVALSPDSKWIISGSYDRTVRIWNAEKGEQVGRLFHGHDSAVYSVAFPRNSQQIASGASDTALRVWNAISASVSQVISETSKHDFLSPDGRFLPSLRLTRGGWIVNRSGDLILWVPHDLRHSLPWPHLKVVAGRKLLKFVRL
ncbi:WD40 repeat-like protein [Serendipita vermifera]|nr:WD40 repeat-like protein [Serendipita vermifera]